MAARDKLQKEQIADPLITLDSKCKLFQFWRNISCEDFSRMLELLPLITGDAIFSDAATRMKKHGFVNGRHQNELEPDPRGSPSPTRCDCDAVHSSLA